MEKTIVELFAGVGGFRLGFERASKDWQTVWANQWEPGKKNQYAFDCYKYHFEKFGGINQFSNMDISSVDVKNIPKHTLLVGGFPCQDYSVAGTNAKGIEGKKGVLWWEIKRIIEAKRPPFILLENVDRLIKSPAKQRGRDFAIMLECLNQLGYGVEWRIINAEEYGLQQRRRRIFIFAYSKNTKYYQQSNHDFFEKCFPIKSSETVSTIVLPSNLLEISNKFSFLFGNSGKMLNGLISTCRVYADICTKNITLSDIMIDKAEKEYFLTPELLEKFKYMKGAKREERTATSGFKYFFSEGSIPFPDILDRPARTMLTSEGSNNRSTHIVADKTTGELRKLTPIECERINGFPDNWTDTGMPKNFRYFCMGNALVVDLIEIMAKEINKIFEQEIYI
ncbi:MAG: DNA (cytosine-5-)-methyltransferase [Alphaproteobacteria bacterium]|nr:DNA (cytosine-5-)-methyltransferase [Alphaproteobacteria bacterium]